MFERFFLRVLRNSNWWVASESGYGVALYSSRIFGHPEVGTLTQTQAIQIRRAFRGNETVEYQMFRSRRYIALFKESLSRDPFVIR
jgi:hypothetical protein